MRDPTRRAFLDANVLVSATLSKSGPAYGLLLLAQRRTFRAYTSTETVREAEDAIARVRPVARVAFRQTLAHARVRIRRVRRSTVDVSDLADPKDIHVVAAALRDRVQYLVTFNVRDFRGRALRERYGLQVMHPAVFLRALAASE